MTFLKWQPSAWIRDIAVIAGAALIAGVPATVASANVGAEASLQPEPTTESPSVSQLSGAKFCPSDLNTAIDNIVYRPHFNGASWGISIKPLSDDTVLYAYHSEDLLIPASNIKLITTGAALRIISERAPQALPEFKDRFEVINRYSDNYLADELLRDIGGQLAVNRALEPLGISSTDYEQIDGSGLSRGNKVKPSTFVKLLKGMYETDESGIFYNSLPVGGVSGTLEYRFQDTPAYGRVHAKTGTLRGVRALSGYVETPDYGTVVFSIVVNQPGQSGGVMLDAIDEMVLNITRVEPCS
ncbi:MAG: D-alanyl-D-alanine carboxypeptidase [Cyanobacteria bacterium J06626_18]